MLHILPECVLIRVHLLEMRLRQWRWSRRANTPEVEAWTDLSLISQLRNTNAVQQATSTRPIVLVDDAIDTGMTVARVVALLEELGVERNSIRIVVVTHSFADPLIQADYYRFSDTVVRFPWSRAN